MPVNHAHAHRLVGAPRRGRSELASLIDLLPSSMNVVSTRTMARQGIDTLGQVISQGKMLAWVQRRKGDEEAAVRTCTDHSRKAGTSAPVEIRPNSRLSS